MSAAAVIPVLFGLGTAVTFGLADFCIARATRLASAKSVAAVVYGVSFVLVTPIYAFLGPAWPSRTAAIETAFGGALIALGALAFFSGLRSGPVSIVSPLGSLYPIGTAVITVVAFGYSTSALQWLGIALAVLGAMAATADLTGRPSIKSLSEGPTRALAAAACWSIGFALVGRAMAESSWLSVTFVQLLFAGATAVIVLGIGLSSARSEVNNVIRTVRNRDAIIAGALQLLGLVFFNVGVGLPGASVAAVTAVSATYPALTTVLAIRQLRERPGPMPIAGAAAAVAGVVVLSLG